MGKIKASLLSPGDVVSYVDPNFPLDRWWEAPREAVVIAVQDDDTLRVAVVPYGTYARDFDSKARLLMAEAGAWAIQEIKQYDSSNPGDMLRRDAPRPSTWYVLNDYIKIGPYPGAVVSYSDPTFRPDLVGGERWGRVPIHAVVIVGGNYESLLAIVPLSFGNPRFTYETVEDRLEAANKWEHKWVKQFDPEAPDETEPHYRVVP